jgi:hypothetical protein
MSGTYGLRRAFLEMAKEMPELLDTLFRHPSTMIVVGMGAFLLFIGETVGTAQELPTGIINSSDRAAMERSGLDGISDPATATQNGQATASPGRWFIDDVARERAEFELKQVTPKTRDTAHVETGVSSDASWRGRAPRPRSDEIDWRTNGRTQWAWCSPIAASDQTIGCWAC